MPLRASRHPCEGVDYLNDFGTIVLRDLGTTF
jgi:hypothetical protein